MTDIVKRLRETSDDWPASLVKLDLEAADEIERLQSELAAVRGKALEDLTDKLAQLYMYEPWGKPVSVVVAHLCDTEWDKSGALLGRVRNRAYEIRSARRKPEENKDSSSSPPTETTS